MTEFSLGDWSRLGGELRAARERAGLTREQFAILAGMSESTVDRMEQGVSRTPAMWRKAEQVVWEQPESWHLILEGGEPTPVADPNLQFIVQAWRRLPPNLRQLMLENVRSLLRQIP